jgi:hypothetical protein
VGIECRLDRPVQPQHVGTDLVAEEAALEQPDAVLPRDGPAAVDGGGHDGVECPARRGGGVGVVPVEHHERVQVAVAGMTDGRDDDTVRRRDGVEVREHARQLGQRTATSSMRTSRPVASIAG